MKHIKKFLDLLTEGAYIDPANPNEVILTYDNLRPKDPQYDNEVLVTDVSKKKSNLPYLLDKYYALVLPNENQMSGFSAKTVKTLDHLGRPKATMDLLKSGNIKGGQAALDNFLKLTIPSVLNRRRLKYVCPLGSTGGLVQMMTDFFISYYGATKVDVPKNLYPSILNAVVWENLADDLVGSERTSKDKLIEKLEPYTRQSKYFSSQIKLGKKISLPYTDPTTGKKVNDMFAKPEYSPQSLTDEIQSKQLKILTQFFGALEEAIDIPATKQSEYTKYTSQKKQEIENILSLYAAAGNLGDPYSPPVDAETISTQIEKSIVSFLQNVSFQMAYALRTSGTGIGTGTRSTFKDKYSYSFTFENALFDCIDNDHDMLIIDDNMLTGTDLRNVDLKIQEIVNKQRSLARPIANHIKMFVLYDMAAVSDSKRAGNRTIFNYNSKPIHDISNDKKFVKDFKDTILNIKQIIPSKVVMSYVFKSASKVPTPSMPKMILDIDPNGAITNIRIDSSKSQLTNISQYDPRVDPNNWNMPFSVNSVIFNSDGTFTPQFEAWARSINLFVNGEKFN